MLVGLPTEFFFPDYFSLNTQHSIGQRETTRASLVEMWKFILEMTWNFHCPVWKLVIHNIILDMILIELITHTEKKHMSSFEFMKYTV